MFSPSRRIGRQILTFSLGRLVRRRRLATSINHQTWTCDPLENRLLLAADVASPSVESNPSADLNAQASGAVVFIDADVAGSEILLAGITPDAEVHLIPGNTDGLSYISRILAQMTNVKSVQIISHGRSGAVRLSGRDFDFATIQSHSAELKGWAKSLTPNADILFFGCDVGKGAQGAKFIETMAKLSSRDIAASNNRTGHPSFGGDWQLEQSSGVIDSVLAMSPSTLNQYNGYLPITIRAAGSTGEETMELQIDGVAVQTWNNVGGNASTRIFQTFTYNTSEAISADRIQVAFTNDRFLPSQPDRNLRVDQISINGVEFEAESPKVFSTGTWKAADGVVPGFRESEYLHRNGYMQFSSQGATQGTGSGSLIKILAAGDIGTETMQLRIRGEVVKTWNNVGGNPFARQFQSFEYRAANTVLPDDIQVAFTNDAFVFGTPDRNLTVDRISIDGVNYETEAPTVFSTGTYKPNDGIVPGYRKSETLHVEGYFQYSTIQAGTGSLISILAAGATASEKMELRINDQVVQTWNGVGGNADAQIYQTYNYRAAGPVTADQIKIAFTNDGLQNAVDRNLRVDKVVLDGLVFEIEAPTVYSTGTWKAGDGIVPGYREGEYLNADGYFQLQARSSTPGVVAIQSSVINVKEGDTSAVIKIVRSQGSDGFVSVDYNTFAASAVANSDFRPTTGKVTFAPGETTKSVSIPLLNDTTPEANELFDFAIDNVTGGALLLAPRTASITITDDDVTLPTYVSFPNSTGLQLNGTAAIVGDKLAINSSSPNATGSAYFNSPVPINGDSSFQSSFQVDLSQAASLATNAGLLFVVQNNSASPGGTTVPSSPTGGLKGQYFKNITLSGAPVLERVEAVNFDWGKGSPSSQVPIDGFSARWTGTIEASTTGAYQIQTNSDDGVRVWVNGQKLIDDWNGHAVTVNTSTAINLTAGQRYSVVVEYMDIRSYAVMQLRWKSPGATAFTAIPGSSMRPTADVAQSGQLGYEGMRNSLAIQFETRMLSGVPNENIVKVLSGGNLTPIETGRSPLIDFTPGATAYAWVDYNGSSNKLRVYVSATSTKPVSPVVTTTVDLAALVGDKAFVGFAAGAGTVATSHQVRNWSLSLDPPRASSIGGGAAGLVSETIVSGLFQPIAIDWSPDGKNLYIAQKDGIVRVVRNGVQQATPVIDISAMVNTSGDRGLSDIAVHPNLGQSPYLYLLFTYDPPEVNGFLNNQVAGPDGSGNRAGRLVRVTLNAATNYTSVVAGSEVVILGANSTWANFNGQVNSTIDNTVPPAGILPDGSDLQDFIASDSTSHGVDSLNFGPDGALYVSIGDGTSFNRVDSRAFRVQDINNLSGKFLRINPITGAGLADNPFYNGNANSNQSKVYQFGFRNPFRFSIDPRNGKVYVGDVGWTNWEEINAGAVGANFGWPFYEGGSAGNQQTISYNATPEAQAFYASGEPVKAPLIALNHGADNINAIIAGDIYVGNAYPADFKGDLFFNDLGQGIVRNASIGPNGEIEKIEVFATGSAYVVQIVQGPDGRLYYVDLDDAEIGRWTIV